MAGISKTTMDRAHRNTLLAALAVMLLQVAAAVYFLFDAVRESGWSDGRGFALLSVLDLVVGLALLAGIAFVAHTARRLLHQMHRHQEALAIAQGALSELIAVRFAGWNLSASEAEVALFALKGFSAAEIADMRGSASGTVRSQLSQIYAKAGVSGQPMLMSLFLDDLLASAR